ncbi:helix-turn-helix domain-containing protein [Streptomyces camelliae]|uniref:Helix-turn-helix transcriptional regulator n=1 Tax=Streptomyces camelliae TaxID=3004093 RepID=A0ABY7NZV7_9ACTN|nr:helix-turn-helix transcriptional regulator [Streptomyces sp. HUAS 2-6]WBO63786.1 helix-turn-helix transcriptional regulator [Streptomyces sp. HUAS 2-6]
MRQPSAPPFNAPAARRLRAALGMGPEHVAYGMRASYGLPYVTPDLVIAWERGIASPSSAELTALAGVLWCSPGELIGRPRTLREHRIARGIAPEDVARAVGTDLAGYLRMEESGQWRGNERQSAALAEVLGLALPDFVTVTGREAKLAELLHSAVTTRWQAYVRPVLKLAPLDKGVLEAVLQALHQDYQGHMAATLSWGGGSSGASESGREFLDRIVENFWQAVESRTG